MRLDGARVYPRLLYCGHLSHSLIVLSFPSIRRYHPVHIFLTHVQIIIHAWLLHIVLTARLTGHGDQAHGRSPPHGHLFLPDRGERRASIRFLIANPSSHCFCLHPRFKASSIAYYYVGNLLIQVQRTWIRRRFARRCRPVVARHGVDYVCTKRDFTRIGPQICTRASVHRCWHHQRRRRQLGAAQPVLRSCAGPGETARRRRGPRPARLSAAAGAAPQAGYPHLEVLSDRPKRLMYIMSFVRARACVRACVIACVRACVRARACARA